MYSISPATVALIQHTHGGMTMRAGKDLRALIRDVLHNSGDEFAFWAEEEARKAASEWRASAVRDAAGIHPSDCECASCCPDEPTIEMRDEPDFDDPTGDLRRDLDAGVDARLTATALPVKQGQA